MASDAAPTPCASCGTVVPRGEMFGIEPELQCPDCAQGIRRRMQVRVRELPVEHPTHVMHVCLGLIAIFFVLTDVIFRPDPGYPYQPWVLDLLALERIWLGHHWFHVPHVFIHAGWLHVLMNGYFIWEFGRLMERFWGPRTTLAVVVAAIFFTSGVTWIFGARGVGFSGVAFALAGFLWGQRRHNQIARIVMTKQLQNFLIMWLVVGTILTELDVLRIGNLAHGAGLVIGYLLGEAWAPARWRWAIPACFALALGTALLSQFVAFGSTPVVEQASHGPAKRYVVPRSEWRKEWLRQQQLRRDQTPRQE